MNAAPETLPLISPLASPVEPLRDGRECTFDPEPCLSAFHQWLPFAAQVALPESRRYGWPSIKMRAA